MVHATSNLRCTLAALGLSALSACGGGQVCPDCFGGLELDVTVLDATTGQPVAGVLFTEMGAPLAFSCLQPTDGGACSYWTADGPPTGTHTITVSAPGYVPADVTYTLDAGPPPGECGCGEIVQKTVKLAPM
jgi:hypothetical protein